MEVYGAQSRIKHILNAKQFNRPFLDEVFFPEAERIARLLKTRSGRDQLRTELRHQTLISLFYEPSTRTRLSFEMAATHLGMHARSTENAKEFSSAAKGETLADTVRTISEYLPDAIVMRHSEDGIIERVAEYTDVPVINAGDGRGQHPTQALLDWLTIKFEKGDIDGRTVAFGGDLANGRTVRSLVYLLSKYRVRDIIFVSHELFRIGEDIKAHLAENSVSFFETDSVEKAFRAADVVYWTRTQRERLSSDQRRQFGHAIKSRFTIGSRQMRWMKPDTILMHPLPRVWEIKPEVDADPRAAYFRQVHNGLIARMALLKLILAS